MDDLLPPPSFNPVLKRERAMTGNETNPEKVKRKILDYYENLAGTSFDYGRPGIRGMKSETVVIDREDYDSVDYKKLDDDLDLDLDLDSDMDSDMDEKKRKIYSSGITTYSIGNFLRRNGDTGVSELNKIKDNIVFLNKSGARNLFNDETVIQYVLDELVAAIPKINSAIKSFQYKIPNTMYSSKDDYYKKYLKYKQKYLELKQKMKK